MSKKKKDKSARQAEPREQAKIVDAAGEPIMADLDADRSPAEGPASMQAERDDLLARLQRLGADYQNYQKRVQKEKDQQRQFANESLMKELLGVLDDMERGLAAGRENHDADDPLLVGMQLVHDKTLEVLGKFGLSVIQADGQGFDPEKHSALMQEESDELPPMHVLRELQKGYELNGRTIRPSAVVVSQPPRDDKEDQAETDQAADA